MTDSPWHVFLAFGDFKEPVTGHNFIVVRQRSKRGVDKPLWSAMCREVGRLVRPWHQNPEELRARNGVPGAPLWYPDGLPDLEGEQRTWDSPKYRRFEWSGDKKTGTLVEVPHEPSTP